MTPGRPAAVLKGIARLAIGRPEGVLYFGSSRRSVVSSLIPLLALPLIGFVSNTHSKWAEGAVDLLAAFSALLTGPVLSHALAQKLGRESLWARYVTANNWCQWALPPMALILSMTVGGIALVAGASPYQASGIVLAFLLPYALWLQWFVARTALSLNGPVAAALVAGLNLGALAVVLMPAMLAAETTASS
jgi:hypothetical protein